MSQAVLYTIFFFLNRHHVRKIFILFYGFKFWLYNREKILIKKDKKVHSSDPN